jgi:hypothetical protein
VASLPLGEKAKVLTVVHMALHSFLSQLLSLVMKLILPWELCIVFLGYSNRYLGDICLLSSFFGVGEKLKRDWVPAVW